MPEPISAPKPILRQIDAIVLIIGIVVGAGIFRAPSVVASNTPSEYWFLGVWVLGGVISIIGALCYSELSSSFPNAGGDYHFLKLAFGKRFSFLFAWSRITITQTGSIAILAYIAGDYLTQLMPLGAFSSTYYALTIIIILSLINILGIQFGTSIQKLLISMQFIGIFIIVLLGVLNDPATSVSISENSSPLNGSPTASISLALIFVLLTFGGWNEAAYISSELKSGSKKMTLVLVASIVLITSIYLLINISFLRVLGLEGIANSEAVGVDMMSATLGDRGVVLIGLLVVLSALSSLNTTIFTGARSNYALGRDFKTLSFLGKWNGSKSAPINSLIVQGVIAIILVLFGALTRSGFESMVDFTAPVFWFFFLSTGVSLLILRKKHPNIKRPFKVPLYPLTPVLFIAFCSYMLYSSLSFTGIGSLVSVAILFTGWLFSLIFGKKKKLVKNEIV
ncbi:MAG TPA: amino acid permease [Bacteroidales bacterium]|nr:amino acid permease [Bacteroidales bacterium]